MHMCGGSFIASPVVKVDFEQMGAATVLSLLGFLSVAMAVLLVFEPAGVGGMVPSDQEEDMELERQLKVLNKPARKSFQVYMYGLYNQTGFLAELIMLI